MVETECDAGLRDARLAARAGLESNPTTLPPRREGMYDPTCERLVVDTARPVEELVAEALRHFAGQPTIPIGAVRV